MAQQRLQQLLHLRQVGLARHRDAQVARVIKFAPVIKQVSPLHALDDIARRADVSQPTDSRTHVDSPLIRVKGKARIRQIAYKAGYQVNLVARILKKGRLARSDWSCRRSATPTFQSSSSALPILPELPTTLTKAQRGRHGR